ncbi:hypothetical protein CVT24_011016 [Panaeolus cyanescens]|uniref:Uncharacterized protein n=1 Tax=Panaeolus cyanescens TaxID=181874 RepID=A0A409YVA5_9AGAR|nr:hypothetical protein CVT24_011016 [Panaeolus cyanescens]
MSNKHSRSDSSNAVDSQRPKQKPRTVTSIGVDVMPPDPSPLTPVPSSASGESGLTEPPKLGTSDGSKFIALLAQNPPAQVTERVDTPIPELAEQSPEFNANPTSATATSLSERIASLSELPAFKTSSAFRSLIDFLRQSPNPFQKGYNHVTSTSTRGPKTFDMHLPKHLRLNRVTYCEDLLNNIVDATLSKLIDLEGSGFFDANDANLQSFLNFLSRRQEPDSEKPSPTTSTPLNDETALTQRMINDILFGCSAATSIIALQATRSVQGQMPLALKPWGSQGVANLDVTLRFTDNLQIMFPELAETYKLLSANQLVDFVGIEVKSLVCGTASDLDEVIRSPWTGWVVCDDLCNKPQYHPGGGKVYNVPSGPDADVSTYLGRMPDPIPAKLFDQVISISQLPENKVERKVLFTRQQVSHLETFVLLL